MDIHVITIACYKSQFSLGKWKNILQFYNLSVLHIRKYFKEGKKK